MDVVAARLKIGVQEADFEQEGRFRYGPDGPTILVRRHLPRARRSFTIAHEIAHWSLMADPAAASVRAVRNAFTSEEVLCNQVAGALLLPADWTVSTYGKEASRLSGLALLERIAGLASASLGATLVRLRDLLGWRFTLLHWRFDGREWIFDGEAGVFPWEQGLVIPGEWTGVQLRGARINGDHVQVWPLPLQIGLYDFDLPAEVLVRNDAAVALVELPADLPPLSPEPWLPAALADNSAA
jgi:hypothetical protein